MQRRLLHLHRAKVIGRRHVGLRRIHKGRRPNHLPGQQRRCLVNRLPAQGKLFLQALLAQRRHAVFFLPSRADHRKALIGNLADQGARLKFYKADVSLRVTGTEAEDKLKLHEPLIRHQLVMLFSAQTSDVINAPDGRENLRQEALKKVQDAINAEEGKPVVEDLLFNNLIIQ